MKILRIVLALTLILALTACGAAPTEEPPAEEVKDHCYQILDADGAELYTVTDQTAVAEIDALVNDAGGESAQHGGAKGDPLYTYVYWQAPTVHAGETEPTGEYLEVFRLQVREDSNTVTTEVLADTLKDIGEAVGVEGLDGWLTFSAEVSQETADALRNPAALAGEA